MSDAELIRGVENLYLFVGVAVFVAWWIYTSICLQVIAEKTGTAHSWFAWLPVLRLYLAIKVARQPGWWLVLFLIPLVNLALFIVVWVAISHRLGRSALPGILTALPLIDLLAVGYLAASPLPATSFDGRPASTNPASNLTQLEEPEPALASEQTLDIHRHGLSSRGKAAWSGTTATVVGGVLLLAVGAAIGAYLGLRSPDADEATAAPNSSTPAATAEPAPDSAPAPKPTGVPSVHRGFFTSVDRKQRCFPTNDAVTCYSAPSGKGATLTVGGSVVFLPVADPIANRGGSMPMGTVFTTPSGYIQCRSSGRGIECYDLLLDGVNVFIIGDQAVVIQNAGVQDRY